jgi:hypothetical protein
MTFAQTVAPTVRLCERIIARHGGTPLRARSVADIPRGHTWHTTGYLVPGPIPPGSELAMALDVLARVQRALRVEGDAGKVLAWDAAIAVALAGPTLRARRSSQAAAGKRTAKARRRVAKWRRQIDDRRHGLTKAAAMAAIARQEGLHPDSVKKAIARRRK